MPLGPLPYHHYPSQNSELKFGLSQIRQHAYFCDFALPLSSLSCFNLFSEPGLDVMISKLPVVQTSALPCRHFSSQPCTEAFCPALPCLALPCPAPFLHVLPGLAILLCSTRPVLFRPALFCSAVPSSDLSCPVLLSVLPAALYCPALHHPYLHPSCPDLTPSTMCSEPPDFTGPQWKCSCSNSYVPGSCPPETEGRQSTDPYSNVTITAQRTIQDFMA